MSRNLALGILLAVSVLGTACSKDKNKDEEASVLPEQKMGLGAFNQDIELSIRNNFDEGDSYVTATFSFYHLTRDNVGLTKNVWDIQASRGEGVQDVFYTNMRVGDFGLLADIGQMSCKEIYNNFEQTGEYPGLGKGGYPHKKHRQTDPEFWFRYSEAMDVLTDAKENRIAIKKGHCYVIYKVSAKTKVAAVFSVKDHKPGQSVVISEIEVFEKAVVQH